MFFKSIDHYLPRYYYILFSPSCLCSFLTIQCQESYLVRIRNGPEAGLRTRTGSPRGLTGCVCASRIRSRIVVVSNGIEERVKRIVFVLSSRVSCNFFSHFIRCTYFASIRYFSFVKGVRFRVVPSPEWFLVERVQKDLRWPLFGRYFCRIYYVNC